MSTTASSSSRAKPKAPGGSTAPLAVQTNAIKYRGKYKELKRKVREVEMENDRLLVKTLRIKRNIQRMRLERALLYEYLDIELGPALPSRVPILAPDQAANGAGLPRMTASSPVPPGSLMPPPPFTPASATPEATSSFLPLQQGLPQHGAPQGVAPLGMAPAPHAAAARPASAERPVPTTFAHAPAPMPAVLAPAAPGVPHAPQAMTAAQAMHAPPHAPAAAPGSNGMKVTIRRNPPGNPPQ